MKLGTDGPTVVAGDGIALTHTQVLLMTLWGEGRSQPVEGRIAIGCVIRNRVAIQKTGQDSYAAVCLAPYQFSCWNKEGGHVNYESVMGMSRRLANGDEIHDPIVRECGWIAHGIIGQWLRDNVNGSTHYFSPSAMKPPGRVPGWAQGKTPTAVVGDHWFYARVK